MKLFRLTATESIAFFHSANKHPSGISSPSMQTENLEGIRYVRRVYRALHF